MSVVDSRRDPTWEDWAFVLAIFLCAVVLSALAGRGHPPVRAAALTAAGIAAAATFATTAWSVRFAGSQRWAYWASACALAALAVGAAVVTPDLHAWHDEAAGSLWLSPWYPLAVTLTYAPAGARRCGAGPTRGWMMVATAVLIGTIAPVMTWLGS
jgi:hypothetical protein